MKQKYLKMNAGGIAMTICFISLSYANAQDIVNLTENFDVIATQPSIAVEPQGIVHIAFWGTYDSTGAPDGVTTDIFYLHNKIGNFSSPIKIGVPSGYGFHSKDLTLAVDTEGYVHLAFRRSDNQIFDTLFDDIFYATNRNSDITIATLLVDGGHGGGLASAGPRRPAIAVDDSGRVHLAFLASAGTRIYYMEKINGTFSTPVEIPNSEVWSVNPPSLAVDKRGFAHISFKGRSSIDPWGDIFYITNSSGQFVSKQITKGSVARFFNAVQDSIEGDPTISIDSNNSPHIVFNHTYSQNVFYTKGVGSEFLQPIKIGLSDIQAAIPYVLSDSNDCIHVLTDEDNYITNCNGTFETRDVITQLSLLGLGKHKIGVSSDRKIHFVFHYPKVSLNADVYYTNFPISPAVSVQEDFEIPIEFALLGNYPNPFNAETTIRFQLPRVSHVVLKIFNFFGQEIRTIVDKQCGVGIHNILWDGKDRNGNNVASGMYIYQLQSDDFNQVKKAVLLK